jgi:hypothetical protein
MHVECRPAVFRRSNDSRGNRIMGFANGQHDRVRPWFGRSPRTGNQAPLVQSADEDDLGQLDLLFGGKILNAFRERIVMVQTQHENPPRPAFDCFHRGQNSTLLPRLPMGSVMTFSEIGIIRFWRTPGGFF